MAFRFVSRFLGAVLLLLAATATASAHPHVWVTMRTQVMFSPEGTFTGLKQAWTFDEAFTAFALQGLERNKDGSYPDTVLKPLAEVNVTSLKEYGYFVKAKSATAKLVFTDPTDYYLTFENDALTLHFVLPLAKPVTVKGPLTLEIYDPTMFVAFSFQERDPADMVSAPKSCALQVIPGGGQMQSAPLNESFFSNLSSTSGYAAQFADKIQVRC